MKLIELAEVFDEEQELQVFDYNTDKFLDCYDEVNSIDEKYMNWKVLQISPYEEERGTAHWAILRVYVIED